MPNQTETPDTELLAIATCLAALRPLSEVARHRVLAYVTERLAAEAGSTHNGASAA
jgi:hypothetical protein